MLRQGRPNVAAAGLADRIELVEAGPSSCRSPTGRSTL